MKNAYKVLDNPSTETDVGDLSEGEIALKVTGFIEKNARGNDIIELPCEIVHGFGANDEHVGKKLIHAIFFGDSAAVTVRMLKDFFRASGFLVASWKAGDGEAAGGELPLSTGLPGAIKLLAVRQCIVGAKIKKSKGGDGTMKNFMNLTKVLRIDPATGAELEDALPTPVPNDLIVEAVNTPLETDDAKSVL